MISSILVRGQQQIVYIASSYLPHYRHYTSPLPQPQPDLKWQLNRGKKLMKIFKVCFAPRGAGTIGTMLNSDVIEQMVLSLWST